MTKNEISVQFKPTVEDYRRVLIWYQWKRIAIIFVVSLAITFALGLFVANLKPKDQASDNRFPIYAALVVIPFFVLGSSYWGIRRQAKKIEAISENTKFTFEDEELEAISPSSLVRVKWDRFNKIIETSSDIVFFPRRMFIIQSQNGILKVKIN